MNCFACHREIADDSNFCYYCGARQAPGAARRRLMRSVMDKRIAGVCGGAAEYFGVDSTVFRILFVFVALATGIVPGVLAYVVAWFLMPISPYVAATAAPPPSANPGPS